MITFRPGNIYGPQESQCWSSIGASRMWPLTDSQLSSSKNAILNPPKHKFRKEKIDQICHGIQISKALKMDVAIFQRRSGGALVKNVILCYQPKFLLKC